MASNPERTRAARTAAERALVRVIHHYGETPGFVLLGGLVPELLCIGSQFRHAGTTDIDVQVDMEIANGSVNTARLERALAKAEFVPDAQVWRWRTVVAGIQTEVKFELLADLKDQPAQAEIRFADCDQLGAVNLRGTGFAARNYSQRKLTSKVNGVMMTANVNVANLAGFLLAKAAAARQRRKPKDWYDIAFVLLHNSDGGPDHAAAQVVTHFAEEINGEARNALQDLRANFANPQAQGAQAYVEQIVIDHPALDSRAAVAEAVVAVRQFTTSLIE